MFPRPPSYFGAISAVGFAKKLSIMYTKGTLRRTGASSKVKVLCECRRPPRYVLLMIMVAGEKMGASMPADR